MSEASSAPPRSARSTGDRCGAAASARARRRDFLVPFWSLKKELARASGRKPCTCSAFRSFTATARFRSFARNRASALFARLTFVLSKVSKTAIAGGDPPHEAAAGPCASRSTGHIVTFTVTQPKLASLRHGLLSSPAALRCSARFTARYVKRARQQQQQKAKSKSRSKDKSRSRSPHRTTDTAPPSDPDPAPAAARPRRRSSAGVPTDRCTRARPPRPPAAARVPRHRRGAGRWRR